MSANDTGDGYRSGRGAHCSHESIPYSNHCIGAGPQNRRLGAIGYLHLSEAVADLRAGLTPRPGAIILELRDQYVEPSLIDALVGSEVPVVLLTGAFERDERINEGHGWAAVMKRPFTVGSVADKVQGIAASDSNV